MPSYSRHDVILVRYPFSDLSGAKIRPGVVVSSAHQSQDIYGFVGKKDSHTDYK